MKIQYGASLLSWILPQWNPEAGKFAIEQTAKHGFDIIEILLPGNMDFDVHTVKRQLKDNNLGVVCSLNLSKETHIPTHPEKALKTIKRALEITAGLGTDFLGGVLHGGIGAFSGDVLQQYEKETIAEVWYKAGTYAQSLGITVGIEPINRYETYVCNTAENVLELIKMANSPALAVHLDTFHMNIEENNFRDPVIQSGKLLKHLHITESHRGMPGEGTVNWQELFSALKEIDFEGNLVLENFSSSVPGMQQAVSLWQKSPHEALELAIGSLSFIKKAVETSI
jgi:D-psicose/D-tagatose/L-ribulose 3-epimerase